MWTWLKERWTDEAKFIATMRGLCVTLGLGIVTFSHPLAHLLGLSDEYVELVKGTGVLITGGATGIAAGDKNLPIPSV